MHKLISHDRNPAYELQKSVVDSAQDIKNLSLCDYVVKK